MLQPLRVYTEAPLHSRLWALALSLNSDERLVVLRPISELPPPSSRATRRREPLRPIEPPTGP